MSIESNITGDENTTFQGVSNSTIFIGGSSEGRVTNRQKPVDVVLASFNIDAAVYGRDVEREEVLSALRGEWRNENGTIARNGVWLLSAGSSFGKTYLATKVLQQVVDSETRKIKDPNVKKVAVLECRKAELTDFIGTLGDLVGLRQDLKSWFAELSDEDRQDETKLKRWLNDYLFKHLESAGTIWLVFDNFEACLGEDFRIQDLQIRAFIESLATNPRNLKVLILTQSVPQIRGVVLPQLRAGDSLRKGLDEKAALEYLKNELPDESEDLHKEFAAKVFYMPMPLNTVTGYLKTTGRALKEVLDEKSDGFRFFEHKEIEEGTKFFIRQQIEAQPDRMKRLLCALTFFTRPLPAEALEPLLPDNENQDPRETIKRLETHNLAEVTIGLRKTLRYNLHAYFRKETESTLLPQNLSLFDESCFRKLIKAGNKANDFKYHKRAQDLFECAEQICHLFLSKDKSNQAWRNNLATAYINKTPVLS